MSKGRRPRRSPIFGQDYRDGLTKRELSGMAWSGAGRPFLRSLMKRSGIHMRVIDFKKALRDGEYVMFRGRAYQKGRMERAQAKVKRENKREMRKLQRTARRAMRRHGAQRKGKLAKKYTMVPAQ